MGHILTWLMRELDADGKFPLKSCAEVAYSRIRGKVCVISPKAGLNPFFWIQEEQDESTGLAKPYSESLSGMYGYSGSIDYSDVKELKRYRLYDFD